MLRTLHGKLVVSLVALLLLIALLLVPMTLFISGIARQEANQLLNRDLAASIATQKVLVRDGEVMRAQINQVKMALRHLNPGIEAYVLDPRGVVLAHSTSGEKLVRQKVNIEPIEHFLHREQLPILGDDPRDIEGQKVFSAAPLTVSGRHEGYLYILLPSPKYESTSALIGRSYALQMRLFTIFGVLFCALVAGLLLFNQLTRRLTRLAQAMRDFQRRDFRGALSLAAGKEEGDEIDHLTAVFARMALRIEEQMEALRQSDAQRRELVSNASHDLRTPLAALRGYIETLLLKEGMLPPEEQQHYLQIAVKHGERLSQLVEELFELSKLDALQSDPEVEPFPLSELVHDVAQKYQLRAEQKGIRLQTQIGRDMPFVCADIGMIERVLENLIENALRHTSSGGSVTLVLRVLEKGQQGVRVQVIDTGSGIAPEELPLIFDRFYRASNAPQNGDRAGAGLGLSIVKRILQLHGCDISAQSAPGKGSTFTFELPRYQAE